jgi:hypothetical protein
VRAWVIREASRTIQAHLPSACSRAWGIICYQCCHSLLSLSDHCLGKEKNGA